MRTLILFATDEGQTEKIARRICERLGILSNDESEKDEIRKITEAYLHETDWNPLLTTHFAGALTYSKYNWLKRKLMQLVAKKGGGPTDTRFDYEFTNWKQVDLFVEQFVEFIQRCKQPDDEYAQRTLYSKPTRRYSVANLRAKAEESA